MSPADDANLLLGLVQRHLRSLRLSLDPQFPEEDWGFTAQQAVEKLLKVLIVLRDQRPPRSHELSELAALAEVNYQLNCLVYKPMQQSKLSINQNSKMQCSHLFIYGKWRHLIERVHCQK